MEEEAYYFRYRCLIVYYFHYESNSNVIRDSKFNFHLGSSFHYCLVLCACCLLVFLKIFITRLTQHVYTMLRSNDDPCWIDISDPYAIWESEIAVIFKRNVMKIFLDC